jgi:rhamnosyl/mannosyltransferase
MRQLRILEIATELPPVQSGVARSAGRIVEELRARGHTIDTITSADAPRHYFGEIRLSALATRWLRLRRLVEGYDLVHLTGPAPLIADSLLARWRLADRAALPPLVYTHGFSMHVDAAPRASALYRRLTAPLMHAADAVVVTTPSYRDKVTRTYRGPVRVIPWASDLAPLDPARRRAYSRDRALKVLFVGQQRPYKGIDTLIDAVAGLALVELTIIGGGPLTDQYRERIAATGATNITHLGPVDEPSLLAAYASHDVICLASTNESEAFGLVLVEAMSQGCVAVASDLPGVCDVVGSAGVLVGSPTPGAWRRTLDELARNPDLVCGLQAAGRAKAATYDWGRSGADYEQLYLELTERPTLAG